MEPPSLLVAAAAPDVPSLFSNLSVGGLSVHWCTLEASPTTAHAGIGCMRAPFACYRTNMTWCSVLYFEISSRGGKSKVSRNKGGANLPGCKIF